MISEHCHIFVTDNRNTGIIDYIYFDIGIAMEAFCNICYGMYQNLPKSQRVENESNLYDFIHKERSKSRVIVVEGEKITYGFRLCTNCNMSALN